MGGGSCNRSNGDDTCCFSWGQIGTIDYRAYPVRLDSQAGDRTPCANFSGKKTLASNVGCLCILLAWKPQAHIFNHDVTSKTDVYTKFKTVSWGIGLSRNIMPKYFINGFQNTRENKISSNQRPPTYYVHHFAWHCFYL